MTSKRDYYEVLGVPRDADAAAIKRAYRKLALEWHPDRNKAPEAAERFKEISEAYAVLSGSDKRAAYDRFGHAGFDERYSTEDIFRGADFESIFRDLGIRFGGGGLGDIFEGIFGGAFGRGFGRPRGPAPGNDLEVRMEVSFKESVLGAGREMVVHRRERCDGCEGTGAKDGALRRCGGCGGSGQVRRVTQRAFFHQVFVSACEACGGRGATAAAPCDSCRGARLIDVRRRVKVRVPGGIEGGQVLRLRGEGEHSLDPRGPPGDLFVHVEVEPDARFERRGADVIAHVPLTYPQAALGTEVAIPGIERDERLKVPAGTQPGTEFRFAGRGAPDLATGRRGDLVAVATVRVPDRLSKEERDLLERLAELESSDVRKGFLRDLKDKLT